jgi:hypothetical protein
VALFPDIAHLAEEGEPMSGIMAMSGMETRHRLFVIDGLPAATGLLSIGEAWAATNPLFGLGMSMGALHATLLRDLLRTEGAGDPEKLSLRFDEMTRASLSPMQQGLAEWDRHRLAEIDAAIRDVPAPYEAEDRDWHFKRALDTAKLRDPELLRAFADTGTLLATAEETFTDPALGEKGAELGRKAPHYSDPGPSAPTPDRHRGHGRVPPGTPAAVRALSRVAVARGADVVGGRRRPAWGPGADGPHGGQAVG